MTKLEEIALAIWRERELGFPPRVRRFTPDAMDKESGAWRACMIEARAVVVALRVPNEAMLRTCEVAAARGAVISTWQDMCDAILTEHP